MSRFRIFVDGQEGTTGLKIHEHLSGREDIEVLKIDQDKRKDIEVRRAFLNNADIVFLCLPDAAAKEAVTLIENDKTRVIDASTAHRTSPDWVYGLPELSSVQRDFVRNAGRVAVPGCHASGFVALVRPLAASGILPADYPISCCSLTGYSGGGKKLISKYEDEKSIKDIKSPKPYALKLTHKHLPEMQRAAGLAYPPVFMPVVGSFYQGMTVTVPLATRALAKKLSAREIRDFLAEYYAGQRFIRVMPYDADSNLDENGFLNPEACNGTNRMEILVFGHEEQILLAARFDNLGKGASGAAIQNMNIMLGLDEGIGLSV